MTEETKQLIEKEKQFSEITKITDISSSDIIKKQKEKDLSNIQNNENFQKLSREITERDVAVKMQKDANEVLSGELKNKYDEYYLKKQKESLDFRMKKEKNIIAQQIKAELKEEKRRIAEIRFGYLYEQDGTYTYSEKGNDGKIIEKTAIKYKDFTASYSINRLKEFQNWYKNQTATVQKIIWSSVKFFVIGGIAVAFIAILIRIIRWLAISGALGI